MRKLARFLVTLLLILGALVGLLRLVAIRWWRVPDDDPYHEASIAPTLRGGDWIVLWRLTPPHLGDLVLCPEPNAGGRAVIGRVAGTSGESVDVQGNTVRINGHRAATQGSCASDRFSVDDPTSGVPTEQRCDLEQLGSRVHARGNGTPAQKPPDGKATLEAGEILLVSDNRLFPYDFRDFGPVQRDTCKETVVFRLWGKQGFRDVESRLTLIR